MSGVVIRPLQRIITASYNLQPYCCIETTPTAMDADHPTRRVTCWVVAQRERGASCLSWFLDQLALGAPWCGDFWWCRPVIGDRSLLWRGHVLSGGLYWSGTRRAAGMGRPITTQRWPAGLPHVATHPSLRSGWMVECGKSWTGKGIGRVREQFVPVNVDFEKPKAEGATRSGLTWNGLFIVVVAPTQGQSRTETFPVDGDV